MKFFAAALVAVLISPSLAWGGTPTRQDVRCPIGGERFTYLTTASYTVYGDRPDGKPYGSWKFPLDLPICPGNGLVIYKDFSKDELGRLPPLLASPEYRALVAETPRYRAAWLARSLDPQDLSIARLLHEATWEADQDPARRARYLQEFAAVVAETAPRMSSEEAFVLRLFQANALRELGRFDEAAARIQAIGDPPPLSGPEVSPEDVANDLAYWKAEVSDLTKVIARRDASIEPLDLLPQMIALWMCLGDGEAPPRQDPYCESEAVRPALEELRGAKAELVPAEEQPR